MKDFIGEELHVGDSVVYIRRHMTGSSSTNKELMIGKIKRFTAKQVVIDISEEWVGRKVYDPSYLEYKVSPDWIACIYNK